MIQSNNEKVYFVQVTDVWNNNYFIGVFNSLDDAKLEVCSEFEDINVVKDTFELKEYASTFCMCFDTEVEVSDDEYYSIRGYILTQKDLQVNGIE